MTATILTSSQLNRLIDRRNELQAINAEMYVAALAARRATAPHLEQQFYHVADLVTKARYQIDKAILWGAAHPKNGETAATARGHQLPQKETEA